ncbi:MAG: helix-turn-helix domain-containing protein [Candidatus Micrarchaeota archaeon]|nr:helix-turn-helix domain-containing protein [Candidatus Micrarchaeota archaeon]
MSREQDEINRKWKEKKVKAATIGFYHQNCQTSISTEKFPHIRLDEVSPVVYLDRKPGKYDYLLMWNVRAEKPSEVDEYLTYVKRHNDTKRLTVLEKSGSQALILLNAYMPSSSYEKVLQSGTISTSPVLAKDGFETYNVVSPDPKGIKKLAHELEAIGDVKIMRVGDYRSEITGPSLTDKQKDALAVALMSGYYSWPRGVGLVQLAQAAKISRRSMQERLRRAEAKLFPHLVKGYLEKSGKK